jgi:predicted RNA-binding Zn-ribbon protein involved in translation (DUF1610 family)/DNA-binding transcriptional MerR regulator
MEIAEKIVREAKKPIPGYRTRGVFDFGKQSPVLYVTEEETFCTSCETRAPRTKAVKEIRKEGRCPVCGKKMKIHHLRSLNNYRYMQRREMDLFYAVRFLNGLAIKGVNIEYFETIRNGKVMIEKTAICYRFIYNDGTGYAKVYDPKTGKRVETNNPFRTCKGTMGLFWRSNYTQRIDYSSFEKSIQNHPNPIFRMMPEAECLNDIIHYDAIAEMLRKTGFTRLYQDYMSGNRSSLNPRGETPEKVFGLTRAEIRIVRKYDCSNDDLFRIKKARKNLGTTLTEDDIMLLRECSFAQNEIKREDGLSIKDIRKIYNRYPGKIEVLYRDYIRNTRALGYPLTQSVLFPKSLEEAHDFMATELLRTQRQRAEKDLKEKMERLKKRLCELANLAYEEKEFCVVVPQCEDDLIREGHLLRHCVGTYLDRIEKGQTAVVFVRKQDAPQEPFVTVEYDEVKNEIKQARGEKNRDPDEEVKRFLAQWIEHNRAKKQSAEPRLRAVACG